MTTIIYYDLYADDGYMLHNVVTGETRNEILMTQFPEEWEEIELQNNNDDEVIQ